MKANNTFIEKHPALAILIMFNLACILVSFIFYWLIPVLFNYAPDSEAVGKKMSGLNYTELYVYCMLSVIFAGTVIIFFILKKIDKKIKMKDVNFLFNMPYLIYFFQIIIPTISIGIILLIVGIVTGRSILLFLRLVSVVYSFGSLIAIIVFVAVKKIFTGFLLKLHITEKQAGFFSLKKRIFVLILPIFISSILFISTVGYSMIVKEKGDILFEVYKIKLENQINKRVSYNLESLQDSLDKIELQNPDDFYFIIKDNDNISETDIKTKLENKLSPFFLTYLNLHAFDRNNRVYGQTGENQGVVKKIIINNELWIVGIFFNVVSENAIYFLYSSIAILILINIFILGYYASSLSGDISMVSDGLQNIVSGEKVDLDKKLPITSKDEIGDLVYSYNKIQELIKRNILEIERNQEIIMEQERLAALGYLIGGIAHSIRTPIMSISGGIEGLRELIDEYAESIDNNDVTGDDHKEIAVEMMEWITKLKPYCTQISNIISTVKTQVAKPDYSYVPEFSVKDLIERINIFLKNELKARKCKLNIICNADQSITISGDITNMIQVLSNLFINACDAYGGKGGKINFIIDHIDNELKMTVQDFGSGIPENIKSRLFKEMITTKGNKGTGIGIYVSYSLIIGNFKGKMWFESEHDKGTSFYIIIPLRNGRIIYT